MDKLLTDYRPATTMLTATAEHLAGILEQLETMRPGSPDHQQLVQLSQLLGAALEESQSSREARTPSDGTDQMPSSALELAKDLLTRQIAGETLTDRELGHLDVLLAASHGQVLLPPDPVDEPDAPTYRSQSDAEISAPEATAHIGEDRTPAKTLPTACKFCMRACVGPEHHAYEALHYNDPAEVKKRDEYATKEMMAMVGKPLPDWCQ